MIYDNVKRLCNEHGTNISQLEKACDIGNGTIGKWKLLNSSPRVSTLVKIASYFGCTVGDLMRKE